MHKINSHIYIISNKKKIINLPLPLHHRRQCLSLLFQKDHPHDEASHYLLIVPKNIYNIY